MPATRPTSANSPPTAMPERIDLADDARLDDWRNHFGITLEQLSEAVAAVGEDPARVREHLLNQGASSGPG